MKELFLMPPASFLEEEVRCGYYVSPEMKRIWAVELDLLAKFQEVCEANGLTYFADGGTILGAVRHRGFIPWDNDIDVCMPRPDYERFLEIGKTAFAAPYFLQTPATEDGRYFSTWAKLCNSNTTGRGSDDFEKGINCGIFIDIFPFDKVPERKIGRCLYFMRISSIMKSARFCFCAKPSGNLVRRVKFHCRRFVYKVVYGAPDAGELFKMFNKAAALSWNSHTNLFGGVIFGYVEKFTWQYNDWSSATKMAFEYLSIPVPDGYDEILTRQYGNYHTFPSDKSTHDYLDFNADVPYPEYFRK